MPVDLPSLVTIYEVLKKEASDAGKAPDVEAAVESKVDSTGVLP